jgi:hypothetical protein
MRREAGIEGEQMDEADEEHHVAEMLIDELWNMRPGSSHYDAKFTVLAETVKHHIDEEEAEILPKAAELGMGRMDELGMQMERRKVELMGDGSRRTTATRARRARRSTTGTSRRRTTATGSRNGRTTRTTSRSASGVRSRATTSTRAPSRATKSTTSRSRASTSARRSTSGRSTARPRPAGASRATRSRPASASRSRGTSRSRR